MIKSVAVTGSISRNAGGLFESVRTLYKHLLSQGVTAEVYGLRDEFTEEDLSAWLPLKPHVFDVLGPHSFSYAPRLVSSMREADVDVVTMHGIWMFPSVANLLSQFGRKVPYLISPHGMLDPWALSNSKWKKRFVAALYERRHLKGAVCLRSLCSAETLAMRRYGLKNPICQIPNGISTCTKEPAMPCPWEHKVPRDCKVLLYLGRLHPKKGLVGLLKGWAAAVRSTSSQDWVLVIAGWDQGGHESELKLLSEELGVGNKVFFIGPRFGDEKNACYQHADGFILPSFSEGLPMVVLEAWSHSLPVVMTDYCNLPEGFSSGSAIRIEPDPQDIARGVHDLFSLSDSERAHMGELGKTLVHRHFSWEQIASDHKEVYSWILGGGSPPQTVVLS